MNRSLYSNSHPVAGLLVLLGLVAGVFFTQSAMAAGAVGTNSSLDNTQATVVSATVTRVGSNFQVSWTTAGDVDRVKVQEGTSPEQIDTTVGEVSGVTTITVTGLDPSQRHYFRVKGGSGDGVIAAERGVPQVGVLNFRDIGGYSTVVNNGDHSKTIRWGMFFRSGGRTPSQTRPFSRRWG